MQGGGHDHGVEVQGPLAGHGGLLPVKLRLVGLVVDHLEDHGGPAQGLPRLGLVPVGVAGLHLHKVQYLVDLFAGVKPVARVPDAAGAVDDVVDTALDAGEAQDLGPDGGLDAAAGVVEARDQGLQVRKVFGGVELGDGLKEALAGAGDVAGAVVAELEDLAVDLDDDGVFLQPRPPLGREQPLALGLGQVEGQDDLGADLVEEAVEYGRRRRREVRDGG